MGDVRELFSECVVCKVIRDDDPPEVGVMTVLSFLIVGDVGINQVHRDLCAQHRKVVDEAVQGVLDERRPPPRVG